MVPQGTFALHHTALNLLSNNFFSQLDPHSGLSRVPCIYDIKPTSSPSLLHNATKTWHLIVHNIVAKDTTPAVVERYHVAMSTATPNGHHRQHAAVPRHCWQCRRHHRPPEAPCQAPCQATCCSLAAHSNSPINMVHVSSTDINNKPQYLHHVIQLVEYTSHKGA